MDNIHAVLLNGANLILDKAYDSIGYLHSIGYGTIADKTLHWLVVTRPGGERVR